MRLMEAVRLVRLADPHGPSFRMWLACGFEPLHLSTFLTAELVKRLPGRRVSLAHGVFDDLAGNVSKLSDDRYEAGVVVMEWVDLDPRLGVRRLGGWGHETAGTLLHSVQTQLSRLFEVLSAASGRFPIAVSLPTLDPAPVFFASSGRASAVQLELTGALLDFAADAAALSDVRILDESALSISPATARRDIMADLSTGFPYSLPHASDLGSALASLIVPPAPKKGIITDLDDTLWRGLLGEEGVDAVSWSIEQHSHIHALYQQTLNAIAESGGLVAVASKNDPALVEEVFRRSDLVLRHQHVFPVEVNWDEKSASVQRILDAWNIAADDVVFVDDSAMELAEVAAAFPGILCLQFEPLNPAGAYATLLDLRSRFSRDRIHSEDRLRVSSIRSAQQPRAPGKLHEEFLAQLDAEIEFSSDRATFDGRPLELINKTNQFNLNGRRLSAGEIAAALADPASFFLVASYEDRYGALGRIAVILGWMDGSRARINTWVMSCRAFSRRIEYQCLEEVFRQTGAESVEPDFEETPRNAPFREFLESLVDRPGESLTRERFDRHKPPLYIKVME